MSHVIAQFRFCFGLIVLLGCLGRCLVAAPVPPAPASADGNRLTYLDEDNPFYPNVRLSKLTTPQWVGEQGVEAVVILAIDDMRQTEKYETVLRPLLERLKEIDRRAPVSIMCNALDTSAPQLRSWLKEGLSLEVHTLAHPCPLLANSNFLAAAGTYHDGVTLLHRVEGNKPVAFRMPCCDSLNSPSPRFYSEIFNRTSLNNQFLAIDSSVMNILTANDPALPRRLVLDPDGKEKFRKYVPFPSFTTTIEDYPYPYVIGKLCWEFPPTAPSDWEAQRLNGTNSPATVADWKAALDATVIKQGVFTFIFHPHGWIRPDQMVEFVDYAARTYGQKVKFLTFREAAERLKQNLLGGEALRSAEGRDNGVRILDLNNDGYMDVVIANENVRRTRVWQPQQMRWAEGGFPVRIVAADGADAGVRFGLLREDGKAAVVVNGAERGAWQFNGAIWEARQAFLFGLEVNGQPIFTSDHGRDRGVRLRDADKDGRCEVFVSNESQNAVFSWSQEESTWVRLAYALPPGTSIVNGEGEDNGLRFVDVNQDGYDDVVWSNEAGCSVHLFMPELYLGFQPGWSRVVLNGRRGESGEIPMIVRSGPFRNNGAWFRSGQMWVQNEETSGLPDHVDRRSFAQLVGGLQPKPMSAQDSLAAMRTIPGFKVELVASEPLLKDPVAFDWAPDGKLWVVEMGDYPSGTDGQGKPGGAIRFLEDTDGDGRYDKSTLFLEQVNFPTGVLPWNNGVLVSAAPEVFYAEDKDGDGKADVRRTLLRGFKEGNQQHRVNGFEYGLDDWIYGANGDSGGQIQSVDSWNGLPSPQAQAASPGKIDLRGHDFRFQPRTGAFETVSGQTQFGRRRDDWGNWFGNNNSTWGWHVYLPEHYLKRNPSLPVKSVKENLANYPDATRVYPISRPLQRFNDVRMLNHVTSANSLTPYRDDLFGPEFTTSIFVSEPVHNAIHREVLEPAGVTFTSHRAKGEENSEFLASSDNWFRPTMMKTGPDGALYIADMYRLVIEHPEWIPQDAQRQFDLRAGQDQGRIYRVYPTSAKLRPIPRLAGKSATELVKLLDSPNGWTRDTVERLLLQNQSRDRAVTLALARLARESANPKVRLQALWVLDGLSASSPTILQEALHDPHPSVRETGVRLCESLLRDPQQQEREGMRELRERLLELVNDSAVRVRCQLAFTLGEWPDVRAGRALVGLAAKEPNDAFIRTAVLSSAAPHVRTMLASLARESRDNAPISLLQELLSLAVAAGREDSLLEMVHAMSERNGLQYDSWQMGALAGLIQGLEHQRQSLSSFASTAAPELRKSLGQLSEMFEQARRVVLDTGEAEGDRIEAIRLLGHGLTGYNKDLAVLAGLLRPQVSSRLQIAAVDALGRLASADVAPFLLKGWKSYEPGLRTQVLGVLLRRPPWTEALLAALENHEVNGAQIAPEFQQKLLHASQDSIRARASRLFAVATDRQEVIRGYQSVLEHEGDAAKGALLFRQNCATCHRLHDEGTNVGPDLAALGNKSPQTLLTAILNPNQAVEARYVNYLAVTTSDREVSGIMVAETPSSVTLRGPGGIEETILRQELKELTTSGLSIMPEGFEKTMNPDELADLISFVRKP